MRAGSPVGARATEKRLQDLDAIAGGGDGRRRLRLSYRRKPRRLAASVLASILAGAGEDPRHVALRRFPAPATVLAGLRLGGVLCLPADVRELLLGIGEVMPDGLQFGGLESAVVAPVAAIPRRSERSELDDRVHAVEQLAVVTDDDGTALPGRQQRHHGISAGPVEIVGRLVEEEEVGLGEE